MDLRYHINTEKIEMFIDGGIFFGKSIFAFGDCAATEVLIDYLEERNISVTAILDNNESKAGEYYKSVSIVLPNFIQNFAAEKAIILIATRFFEQMAAQLRNLGFYGRIEKLIDYYASAEYSLSDEVMERKTQHILIGKKTLAKIRKQYPKEHLVICPLNAIGDVYVTLTYLPEYLKKNNFLTYVVIVNGRGCYQVAEMFQSTAIMLNDMQMDELVQAIIFNHESNCILAHHDRIYTDNTINWLDKHKLTFEDFYKYAIFGLPKTAEQHYPSGLVPFENIYGFPEGKTVIISPYAKSVVGIPLTYWQEIILQYQANGYTVATSVVGNEQPLPNTIMLSIPLNQVVSAVEFAGFFIGIRSGLCDVIGNAKCDKTVIFPDRYYSTTQWKLIEFWGMPKWKQIIYSR